MRDALTNVVLFSDWAASANPVQRNIHIGKRSCVETTFNHCNLPNLIDATKTGFTDLDVGKSSAVPARQHATVRDRARETEHTAKPAQAGLGGSHQFEPNDPADHYKKARHSHN